MCAKVNAESKIYVVEHLDSELGEWSALEYKTIGQECKDAGAIFMLSSLPTDLQMPKDLSEQASITFEHRDAEAVFADRKDRICLLDPAAPLDLQPQDGATYDIFLFGGILGDDPPRDRTSELRKKGFHGRRLGSVQMTTDTAARVVRKVIQDKVPLQEIPYVDFPELKINEHESIEMPFRYIKTPDGKPVMPNGMMDLIKKDSEKGFGELF